MARKARDKKHESTPSKADEMLRRIRVAKGTLIGVRECLADALDFVNRGIGKVQQAYADMEAALDDAGIPHTSSRRRAGPPRGKRAKKAPAKSTGARRPRRG